VALPSPVDVAVAMARIQPALDAVRHPGVRVLEVDGAYVTFDPSDKAEFASTNRNRALIPGLSGRCGRGAIEAIQTAFAERGIARYFVWVSPCEGAEAALAALHASDMRAVDWMEYPTLVRGTEPMPLPSIDGEVRRVNAEEAARWRPSLDIVFGSSSERFRRGSALENFDHYVVLEGGEPVAAAALCNSGSVSYLFAGTVRESHRGRGYQRALIAARIDRAAERGSEWCISETVGSPAYSLGNLLRCGFVESFRKQVFEQGSPPGAH